MITLTASHAELLAAWADAIPRTTAAQAVERKLAHFGLIPFRDEDGKPALRPSPRITIPACRCSDRQLEQVGCDCEHERAWNTAPKDTVTVWVDGYPSNNRCAFPVLHGTPPVEIEAEVSRHFGGRAKVAEIAVARSLGPPEHFSREYIRMMSQGG